MSIFFVVLQMKSTIRSSCSEKACENLSYFVVVLWFFVQPMQMASSESVNICFIIYLFTFMSLLRQHLYKSPVDHCSLLQWCFSNCFSWRILVPARMWLISLRTAAISWTLTIIRRTLSVRGLIWFLSHTNHHYHCRCHLSLSSSSLSSTSSSSWLSLSSSSSSS
jgi:hypothetical protein